MTPAYPTARKTLRILHALLNGDRLTVASALQGYAVYAVSQECGRLRKLGWQIESEYINVSPGVYVKKYWIEPAGSSVATSVSPLRDTVTPAGPDLPAAAQEPTETVSKSDCRCNPAPAAALLQGEAGMSEIDTPTCDKCGAEITTGLMAVFCPGGKECEFWVPEVEEFKDDWKMPAGSPL